MRNIFRRILALKLKFIAKLVLRKYRPTIIGITGSVGKTSAKRAIYSVLSVRYSVRSSRANFNNEFGLPMSIIGDWSEVSGIFFWPKVLLTGLGLVLIKQKYPEMLILEYGIDKPRDMEYLLSIVKPNVGVFTAVGDIPVHVEFFSGPDAVAKEKGKLVESLSSAGFAIVNHDDDTVMLYSKRTRARMITYGFGKGADVQITGFKYAKVTRKKDALPEGISCTLRYAGTSCAVTLHGVYGKVQAYAAAAAAASGIAFEINLATTSEALKNYTPAPGRMRIINGIKNSFIMDDSYNASPLSMHAALHTLKELPGKRKVAVLGDMRELGTYTISAHETIGALAAKNADLLLTVGEKAKFIAEAAQKAGMKKNKIMSFDDAFEAGNVVAKIMKRGDLVLVKASRGVHLERVVKEISLV